MNEYDKEILQVLLEAGSEGISVQKISRHVFNACNSFFNPVDYNSVHEYVLQYLQKNSKLPTSLITRTSLRGVYCLNLANQQSQQLVLQFKENMGENNGLSSSDSTDSLELSLPLF